MTINHNLLMQDILSLTDKEEEESKWAIIKLENDDGQHWWIHIARFMLKAWDNVPALVAASQLCLGNAICHQHTKTGHTDLIYCLVYDIFWWDKLLNCGRMRLQLNCPIHSTTLLPTASLRTPQCCLYIKVFQKGLNSSVPIQAVGLYAKITEEGPMTFAR